MQTETSFTCFLSNLLREVALFILVTHYFTVGLLLPPIFTGKANAVLLVAFKDQDTSAGETMILRGWMDGWMDMINRLALAWTFESFS